jgi:hypothetical protein
VSGNHRGTVQAGAALFRQGGVSVPDEVFENPLGGGARAHVLHHLLPLANGVGHDLVLS